MSSRRISAFASVALTSIAVLNLEIVITRIFSVLMWVHFAFTIVSLAGMLCYGLALALVVRAWPREDAV